MVILKNPTDGFFRVNCRAAKFPPDLVEEQKFAFPIQFPEATNELIKLLPFVKKHEAFRRGLSRNMSKNN